jgi:hypothetical protein
MTSQTIHTTDAAHDHADSHLHSYDDALAHVRARFPQISDIPLFTTDADDLWLTFLSAIPSDRRQHYNCRACKHFIERYGDLAIVQDGRVISALWPSTSTGEYEDRLGTSFRELARVVARSKITGVFVAQNGTKEIGTPQTLTHDLKVWRHFSVPLASKHVNKSPIKLAHQVAAEKREEFEMLSRAFGDFKYTTVQRAVDLLKSGQLLHGEKHLGVASWLLNLYDSRARVTEPVRTNLVWLAVADAPPGWCHVRSSMIGNLLEDIEVDLSFDQIKRSYDAKMHPLQYLRPQAEPSEGNIEQAEKIIKVLRASGSLDRRYAQLDEVDALWKPTPYKVNAETGRTSAASENGVFGHLRPTPHRATYEPLPPVSMTWVKFRDTVLVDAQSIEFKVSRGRLSYCAIVTAANADAPPIMQWDREDQRNPASWYLYDGGSYPSAWNMAGGDWAKVNAFALRPCHWYGNKREQDGDAVVAILDGCRDKRVGGGGSFFPQNLRTEYHSIRRVMEAYSRDAIIPDRDKATACGVMLSGGQSWTDIVFRVTTKSGMVGIYTLDRWD